MGRTLNNCKDTLPEGSIVQLLYLKPYEIFRISASPEQQLVTVLISASWMRHIVYIFKELHCLLFGFQVQFSVLLLTLKPQITWIWGTHREHQLRYGLLVFLHFRMKLWSKCLGHLELGWQLQQKRHLWELADPIITACSLSFQNVSADFRLFGSVLCIWIVEYISLCILRIFFLLQFCELAGRNCINMIQ